MTRQQQKGNLIQEVFKGRFNSGNSCYHSAQNLLSSPLLSKNVNISVSVVLYEYETWFFTAIEEHRLTIFENSVLRRLFGPERGEVMGYCGKLQNEEIQNLYSSSCIIRINK